MGKQFVILPFILFLKTTIAANPVCNPASYTINTGHNSTIDFVFATITCTDPGGGAVTYSMDTSVDGYSYFKMDGNVLKLAHLVDVEYGLNSWTVQVIAADGAGLQTSVLITVNTFTSTTTTTTTPPPPGYDWFDSSENKILFGSTMGLVAVITGACILMCFRFHRKGTCLPSSCPEFHQCIASCKRQANWCPLPCDFYGTKKKARLEEEEERDDRVYEDTFPGPPPIVPTPKKKSSIKSTRESSKPKTPSSERSIIMTPLNIGNANLSDVGIDAMREPGHNAPMFTTYGGKKGHVMRSNKRYNDDVYM